MDGVTEPHLGGVEEAEMPDIAMQAGEGAKNGRAGDDDDEEGESTGEHPGLDDSSEEEEDDSEEERRLKKDFIADEEEEHEGGSRKHKRRKHKHKHRHRKHKHRRDVGEDSDEGGGGDLDEDDLDLVAENTGVARKKPEKRRLRRAGSVASEDLDEEDRVQQIWGEDEDEEDLDEGPSRRRGDGYEDGLDDFIEDDEDDEDAAPAARSQKAKGKATAKAATAERQRQAGKVMGSLAPAVSGISKAAWEEVMETFGDGLDYEWALELDEEDEPMDADGEALGEGKTALRLRDIFEPSELKERMLTDADEAIRVLDVPERTQLAAAGLSVSATAEPLLEEDDIDDAAKWISMRISPRCLEQFILKDQAGFFPPFHHEFLQALGAVIRFFTIDYLEVPFVWAHRRDYITGYNAQHYDQNQRTVHFLTRDDLWKVQTLSFRYRALLERKRGVARLFEKLQIEDAKGYFNECFSQIESVDEVNDLMQWLRTHYGTAVTAAQADWRDEDDLNTDLGPGAEKDLGVGKAKPPKFKKAARDSRFERALASSMKDLALNVGITAQDLASDFVTRAKLHFTEDPDRLPIEYADAYANPDTEWDDATKALEAAKLILSTQISKDPILKKYFRDLFRQSGVVSVSPTEKGMTKIDEAHPFYTFKYLQEKPLNLLLHTPQFLQILSAEADLLVTVAVHLSSDADDRLRRELAETYKSDGTSELATEWNKFRQEILDHAIDHSLLPDTARWARNYLREESEAWLAQRCGDILEDRIEVAPFRPRGGDEGEIPSVVAISNGAGDIRRDSTFVAFMDQHGRFRDHMVFSDLRDEITRNELLDFLRKRMPDVIVVGGFTAATYRLLNDIKSVASMLSEKLKDEMDGDFGRDGTDLPIITVRDDTARIYQLSKRAANEFGSLTSLGKYCVALARYVQSPLNEYAALGKDLLAASFLPDQSLLPPDVLYASLERSLVNVVNLVGVDINKSVHDNYYQHLLPFVCGLGPRKATQVIKAINAIDGTLRTREELVLKDIATAKIFYNCASFLRIPTDEAKADYGKGDTEPDVLDDTRIHPEDYHIARKMAADALELDEEDVAGQHPSKVVEDLIDQGARKLDELSLDDFAEELERLLQAKKRFTLYQIREELQNPHREKRARFLPLTIDDFFGLVTGESEATLSRGLVIPTKIVRHRERDIIVRLDSGLEGTIAKEYMVESGLPDMSKFPVGATIPAMVIEIHKDRFSVELNAQPTAVAANAGTLLQVQPDRFYNHQQAEMDKESAESRKKKGSSRTKRVIKHPNFHNFSAGQAEQFLSGQPRGECVIRPSSRGPDHLAVTWKVDEGVYQHIDVLELDKPTDFALGRSLRIGGKYNYSDLDELIFSHIRGMARKVEEMMLHEKYKGTKEDLASFLSTSLLANPDRAIYGFAIDKDSAGRFLLGFRTKNMPNMSTQTVKVLPTAFQLGETELPDMLGLCNAFKMQQANRQLGIGANAAAAGNRSVHGGRTPYGAAVQPSPMHGGLTPQLNYGGVTPKGAGYGQNSAWGQSTSYPPQRPPPQVAYGAGYPPQQNAWAPQQQAPPPQGVSRAYGYR